MSSPVLRWVRPHLNENATRQALAMLSTAERERFEATPSIHRESFLAGRLVLRRLAAELTGLEPAEVELVAVCPDCGGSHGRPTLVGSDLQLSLSHRADAVVAAALWGAPVGVDVETPASEEAVAAVASLVASEAGSEAGEGTLLHWMRIEAVLKADGRGLRVDPRDVALTRVGDHLEGTVSGSSARYRVEEIELAPDLVASVAVGL